jgi:hypothetical protein
MTGCFVLARGVILAFLNYGPNSANWHRRGCVLGHVVTGAVVDAQICLAFCLSDWIVDLCEMILEKLKLLFEACIRMQCRSSA